MYIYIYTCIYIYHYYYYDYPPRDPRSEDRPSAIVGLRLSEYDYPTTIIRGAAY